MPLDELPAAPRNPKEHDATGIRRSIERFGFTEHVLVDERTGRLVAGHGRVQVLRDMEDAGTAAPAGVLVDTDGQWTVPVIRGWSSRSDAEAEAYLLASNRLTERGGWDEAALLDMLQGINDPDLMLTAGFDTTDMDDLLASLNPPDGTGHEDPTGGAPADDDDTEVERSDGSLLALADVSVAEPQHKPEPGAVYRLGGRHLLYVCDVMNGWPHWVTSLQRDALFVPYPGPYAALTSKADTRPLVLVQPDTYIAGHLLDKYAAIHGEQAVEFVMDVA